MQHRGMRLNSVLNSIYRKEIEGKKPEPEAKPAPDKEKRCSTLEINDDEYQQIMTCAHLLKWSDERAAKFFNVSEAVVRTIRNKPPRKRIAPNLKCLRGLGIDCKNS